MESMSGTIRSITPSSRASSAEYAVARSTVSSRASALRLRAWAMLRMKALVSALILRESVGGMSPPSDLTGEAAPMVVPGAMTAKWAAAVMKVPADAARAPAGPTNTATGTSESRIPSTISRVDSSRPPGVSSWMTTSDAPLPRASSIPRAMRSAVRGSILPSISTTSTDEPSAEAESPDCHAKTATASITNNAVLT